MSLLRCFGKHLCCDFRTVVLVALHHTCASDRELCILVPCIGCFGEPFERQSVIRIRVAESLIIHLSDTVHCRSITAIGGLLEPFECEVPVLRYPFSHEIHESDLGLSLHITLLCACRVESDSFGVTLLDLIITLVIHQEQFLRRLCILPLPFEPELDEIVHDILCILCEFLGNDLRFLGSCLSSLCEKFLG